MTESKPDAGWAAALDPQVTGYPRWWKNKLSGVVVRVMPWWDLVPSEKADRIDSKTMPCPQINVPWRFGMLVQIGYLLENESGIWFGVGPKAAESFEDLGQTKPKKEKPDGKNKKTRNPSKR